VGIKFERRLNAVMTEALAHRLDINSFLQEQRGMRLSEAVEPNGRQLGQYVNMAAETPSNDVRILSSEGRRIIRSMATAHGAWKIVIQL
jgi:hypothetical protein